MLNKFCTGRYLARMVNSYITNLRRDKAVYRSGNTAPANGGNASKYTRCDPLPKWPAWDISKYLHDIWKCNNWLNCQILLIPGVPSRMKGGLLLLHTRKSKRHIDVFLWTIRIKALWKFWPSPICTPAETKHTALCSFSGGLLIFCSILAAFAALADILRRTPLNSA